MASSVIGIFAFLCGPSILRSGTVLVEEADEDSEKVGKQGRGVIIPSSRSDKKASMV